MDLKRKSECESERESESAVDTSARPHGRRVDGRVGVADVVATHEDRVQHHQLRVPLVCQQGGLVQREGRRRGVVPRQDPPRSAGPRVTLHTTP